MGKFKTRFINENVAGIKSRSYVMSIDGTDIARIMRVGDRFYPWGVVMPGHRIPNQATLVGAEREVEREYLNAWIAGR